MGGLACALALAKKGFQDIEVFETASNLGFVGAGIQLAPNMVRILDRLGVWGEVEKEAVILKETSIRRGCYIFPHAIPQANFNRGRNGH
jgi:salicylate hydroxylase